MEEPKARKIKKWDEVHGEYLQERLLSTVTFPVMYWKEWTERKCISGMHTFSGI